MEEYYAQIRNVHIATALASGGLFALRGFAINVLNATWPMWAPIRYASYAIDTVLLTAALMLMTIVQQFPFVDAWLTVKILLVILYIFLGSFALKRGKSRSARLGFFAAATLVFAFIYTVARAHDPLGIFSGTGVFP